MTFDEGTRVVEIIGEIKPAEGGQLSKEVWIDFIAIYPAFLKPAARERINPFTKKPHTFSPPATSAQVVMNGTNIGSLYWAVDDSNVLLSNPSPNRNSRFLKSPPKLQVV